MSIRVIAADGQVLVRAGFRMIIDSASDLAVVGGPADGERAVELARNERPDVVIMDIRMPGVDGWRPPDGSPPAPRRPVFGC